jgi:hypothetical protein
VIFETLTVCAKRELKGNKVKWIFIKIMASGMHEKTFFISGTLIMDKNDFSLFRLSALSGLSLMLFTPLAFAVPANDNLAAAIEIDKLPYTQQLETAGAGNESGEKTPQCLDNVSASVWYQYTPSSNQTVLFNTFGAEYDTALSVWEGTRHPLTQLACNDDSSNLSQSQITVELKKGALYYINISGYQGETGSLNFNAKAVSPLSNDDLEQAIPISFDGSSSYTHTQMTQGATHEAEEYVPSCYPNSHATVWYQYTPAVDESIILNTLGSDYNTVLSVWEGNQHPLEEIACNDDNTGQQSEVRVEVEGGVTYSINIASGEEAGSIALSEETGLLVLNITTPPVNDHLANATVIDEPLPYTTTQSTGGATIEIDEEFPSCHPAASGSIWYKLMPNVDYNTLSISTFGSAYDTVLSIWEGEEHPLTELACNDNADVIGEEQSNASQITIPLTENLSYIIEVSGVEGETGQLNLRLEEGKGDFKIARQPEPMTIESCETATLTVGVSNLEGESIDMTANPVGSQWETGVALPFVYQWYQGEIGDESQPVGTDSDRLTTPAISQDTPYWVRISNPAGIVDSERVLVTVNQPEKANGIGINAEGEQLATQAHFVGEVLSEAGNRGNNLTLRKTDKVSLDFRVTVDPEDVLKPADILMVAFYVAGSSGEFYMRENLIWEQWEQVDNPAFAMSHLTAAQSNIALQDCLNVTVYEGDLQSLVGYFELYVGYRLVNTGEVIYSGESLNFTVK